MVLHRELTSPAQHALAVKGPPKPAASVAKVEVGERSLGNTNERSAAMAAVNASADIRGVRPCSQLTSKPNVAVESSHAPVDPRMRGGNVQ